MMASPQADTAMSRLLCYFQSIAELFERPVRIACPFLLDAARVSAAAATGDAISHQALLATAAFQRLPQDSQSMIQASSSDGTVASG